jgi:hypothetical protein
MAIQNTTTNHALAQNGDSDPLGGVACTLVTACPAVQYI